MNAYRASGREQVPEAPRYVGNESWIRTNWRQFVFLGALFVTFVLSLLAPSMLYLIGVLYLCALVVPSMIATVLVVRSSLSRKRIAIDVGPEVHVRVGDTSNELDDESRSTIASWGCYSRN